MIDFMNYMFVVAILPEKMKQVKVRRRLQYCVPPFWEVFLNGTKSKEKYLIAVVTSL